MRQQPRSFLESFSSNAKVLGSGILLIVKSLPSLWGLWRFAKWQRSAPPWLPTVARSQGSRPADWGSILQTSECRTTLTKIETIDSTQTASPPCENGSEAAYLSPPVSQVPAPRADTAPTPSKRRASANWASRTPLAGQALGRRMSPRHERTNTRETAGLDEESPAWRESDPMGVWGRGLGWVSHKNKKPKKAQGRERRRRLRRPLCCCCWDWRQRW